MSDNIQIRPALTFIDGQLIEAYERITNAPSESIEALGLDPALDNWARIGVTSVNEYVRLIAKNIQKNTRHSWNIIDLGQDIEIDSIFIDAPNQDSFDLEVYDGSTRSKILDLTISKDKAPYDLPNMILPQNLTLKIFARDYINIAIINCRPAVLLKDLPSRENLAAENGTQQ